MSSVTEQASPAPVTGPHGGFAAVRARAQRSAWRAWPAMAVYLAVRLVGTLVFGLVSSGHGYAARGMFVFVDSGWYQKIAERGYDTKISPALSPFAFDPLYPALMALGHAVTGGLVSVTAVGLTVTWLAAVACSWALYELGRLLRDARTGLIFAALWALMPSAVIQGALYADTLAICLTAWALYALLRRAWLTAGVLACLAGATRPTADAVVLTVCLAAVVEFVRSRRQAQERGLTQAQAQAQAQAQPQGHEQQQGQEELQRRGGIGWRPWAAAVIAPIGAIGFLAYVSYRMGSISGYMKAQKKWGTGFGNASQVLHRIKLGIEGTHSGYNNGQAHITTAVLLIVPILIIVMLVQRQRWELTFYTIVVAAIIYTAIHDYSVVPREMLAAFPILLAPAGWLAKVKHQWIVWLLIAILAVAAGWYACFIPVDGGAGYP
jgi:Dolichyl-phosphate-mannose-protein mannosyltransferase